MNQPALVKLDEQADRKNQRHVSAQDGQEAKRQGTEPKTAEHARLHIGKQRRKLRVNDLQGIRALVGGRAEPLSVEPCQRGVVIREILAARDPGDAVIGTPGCGQPHRQQQNQ